MRRSRLGLFGRVLKSASHAHPVVRLVESVEIRPEQDRAHRTAGGAGGREDRARRVEEPQLREPVVGESAEERGGAAGEDDGPLGKQEIATLKKEQKKIQQDVGEAQNKVDQAPIREQEMIPLTRDYENLKRSYDELKRKKLDADIAQNLERRQKGEQFQVLDGANVPEQPLFPNPLKAHLLGAILACLAGFGGAIGVAKSIMNFHTRCSWPSGPIRTESPSGGRYQ